MNKWLLAVVLSSSCFPVLANNYLEVNERSGRKIALVVCNSKLRALDIVGSDGLPAQMMVAKIHNYLKINDKDDYGCSMFVGEVVPLSVAARVMVAEKREFTVFEFYPLTNPWITLFGITEEEVREPGRYNM